MKTSPRVERLARGLDRLVEFTQHATNRLFQRARRTREQRLLVVAHSGHVLAAQHLRQVQQVCRYALLEHSRWDMAQRPHLPDLSAYSAVLLLPGTLVLSSDQGIAQVQKFVQRGGGLVAVQPEFSDGTKTLLGVLELRADGPKDRAAARIAFTYDLMPGLAGLVLGADTYSDAQDVRLDGQAVTMIARSDVGSPIAWKLQIGAGTVLVWNTDVTGERSKRGLLLQSLFCVHPASLQPIVNGASMHVDDFPAGFTDREVPLLQHEFGLSFLRFLDQVWLPDMLELARTFALKFTFTNIFNYHDRTAAPHTFDEWDAESYPVRFAERIKDEHELAFHGYNHVPLVLSAWKSQDAMADAMTAAMTKWISDGLGPLPTSYVPPMNQYDEAGCLALREAIRSVRVICGCFWSDPENGEIPEFGPEPCCPALFRLPRYTSGYRCGDMEMFDTLSQLAILGLWTHFVHADDIIETEQVPGAAFQPRNAGRLGWRRGEGGALLVELKRWISWVKELQPTIQFLTATAAADAVQRFLGNRVQTKLRNSRMTITARAPVDVRLRLQHGSRKQLGAFSGLTLLHIHRGSDYNLYTLRLTGSAASIEFRDSI